MPEAATGLSAWESFYVIVGSSGGALIGLQFVVMTLIADSRIRAQSGALSAFGAPTIVHLTGALVVSAIMSAPWPSLGPLSIALGIYGIGGLTYAVIVVRRAMRQTDYRPVWQDWVWYTALLVPPTPHYSSTPYFCGGIARSRCSSRLPLRSDCCSSAFTMRGTR